MSRKAPEFSIILAAGKGTRMRSSTCHKVCFPVDGRPVICRGIDSYNRCGIGTNIIVVGAMAGQVVETVGREFGNVVFAYQAEQLGTAHAVRCGLNALARLGAGGDVLLVAGDRIIDVSVLERLFDTYYSGNLELAILATPRRKSTSQGRIITARDGSPAAIVEGPDIRQRRTFSELRKYFLSQQKIQAGRIAEIIRDGFSGGDAAMSDAKYAKAFGRLWEIAAGRQAAPHRKELLSLVPESMQEFSIRCPDGGEIRLSPEQADSASLVNNSVYVVKAKVLAEALANLSRDNAQQEEYLSDVVGVVFRASHGGKPLYRTGLVRVENHAHVLGFNDPAELLEMEAVIQAQGREEPSAEELEAPSSRTVAEWEEIFSSLLSGGMDKKRRDLMAEFKALYSDDREAVNSHLKSYLELAKFARKIIGPSKKVFIVRSPGRVNVMGRHIDHQGGNCNLMTIGYETLMIVHPRADDKVLLHNIDRRSFGSRQFSIGELVSDLPWDDWLSVVNSRKLSEMIDSYGVDWSQYVKAAVLRLQKKFTQKKLRGMEIVVSGNVPMAAGLSSSSSLVVGAAEAVVAVNRLDTFPSQFVTLCGEGEWFVGTRGGSADHAAVKFGQKGKVVRVKFFDFAILDTVPFPDDYVLAVCDSGIKAVKSANVKDQFNHRITCYRIGFMLIRKFFPQYAPLLHHLRDVNAGNLGIPLAWIYRILLHLPEQARRDELQALLPGEDLEQFFRMHNPPADGLYPVRGVVLFGLAEFERAARYAGLLRGGRIDEIGKMMDVSHNGDRVVEFTPDWKPIPYNAPTGNAYLLGLIEDLESGDPERVLRAQLHRQPGSYHCSLPAIDRMVDIARTVEGVAGAQLAGAGLGGCMMVLAHRDSVKELVRKLDSLYYKPERKPVSVLTCKPVAGSGILFGEK